MTAEDDGKIVCLIDNARTHSIQVHIKHNYSDPRKGEVWSLEKYVDKFGKDAPLLSDTAKKKVAEAKAKIGASTAADAVTRLPVSAVFGIPPAKAVNSVGKPLTIAPYTSLTEETRMFVPDVDKNYVYNIELLKSVLIGYELNKTIYLHGLHGSGKSTILEQVAARTGRPYLRLQHTVNTEESHIVGQWTVIDGETKFQLGPLPMAMQMGLIFCADEYDRAMPSVTSVYQAVLEGKSLMIKEAPPEMRIIKPHKDFRFVGTGNTNGSGDDTGLYQGTQVQDAANYSRFAITERVEYPEEKVETAIVAGQGGCRMEEAGKLVKFATEVRKAYSGGQISATISPRELINAAFLGLVRAGDFRGGLKLAFANRLSATDREVCDQFAQRIFG